MEPNLCPSNDVVDQLVVWVHISSLPIEYYDKRVLTFNGNRIGKAINVDKNTLTRERGKYVRLCIQFGISKPLLSMFVIKGRHYKVE